MKIMIVFKRSFLILCILIVNIAHGQVDLKAGLEGFYPFTGNALDSSGNNNDGTVNNALLTTDRFSNDTSAYLFNGASSSITLGDIFDLPDRSVNVWFNASSFAGMGNVIYNSDDTSLQNGFTLIRTLQSNGRDVVEFSAREASTIQEEIIQGNQWYMATLIVEDSIVTYYLDTMMIGSFIAPGALSGIGTPMSMIGISAGQTQHFDGKIDDVRIYDRKLKYCEILQLFLGSTKPGAGPIIGNHDPRPFDTETYAVPAHLKTTFSWNITNGNILFGQGTPTIDVEWSKLGIGLLELIETDSFGCVSDTAFLQVLVQTGLQEHTSNMEFRVYPNPFNDILHISFPSSGEYRIQIVDVAGKKWIDTEVISQLQLSFLPGGIYMISILDDDLIPFQRSRMLKIKSR